jgi:hypothetical protein
MSVMPVITADIMSRMVPLHNYGDADGERDSQRADRDETRVVGKGGEHQRSDAPVELPVVGLPELQR